MHDMETTINVNYYFWMIFVKKSLLRPKTGRPPPQLLNAPVLPTPDVNQRRWFFTSTNSKLV